MNNYEDPMAVKNNNFMKVAGAQFQSFCEVSRDLGRKL